MKKSIIISSAFIFIYLCICQATYLTKSQWISIQKIIKHPNPVPIIREKVNKILFFYYNDWSLSKAYSFKKLHCNKCLHIPLSELSMYASMGLLQSIERYDGTTEFTQYATFYINGELYNAITKLHPITPISKKIRRQKKEIFVKNPEVFILNDKEWLLNNLSVKRFKEQQEHESFHQYFIYKEAWDKINTLDPFTKRILHYKYNFYFDKIRTNQEISELLCVSNETIRKKIISIK